MNATLTRLTRLANELSHQSDGQLLDCFLAGSQLAFRELVERHGGLVFAVCRRVLRHQQDAEDAFQAVFLVLARRAADVWPRDAVACWLHGVAQRVALKARASRARRQVSEQPLTDVPQPLANVSEPDTAEIVDRVIRKLPQVYRAAVVACDLEGLSRRDAATQLGWKEGTLSGRLARARELLARQFRRLGLTPPAAGVAALLDSTRLRAGLVDDTVRVTSATAGAAVPASVATLSEGVIPVMFSTKLKFAVATVLVACSLGLGAWAAGAGVGVSETPMDGEGPASGATFPQGPTPATDTQPPVAKTPTALTPLQGKWQVVGITLPGGESLPITETEKYPDFEFNGTTLLMPYRVASTDLRGQIVRFWRLEKYSLSADDTKTPKTIDLVASGKPVGRGIYEFTAPATTCTGCHQPPFVNEPLPAWFAGKLRPAAESVVSCGPSLRGGHTLSALELRLAIGTAGTRPTKFGSGAEGVTEFQLRRESDRFSKLRAEYQQLEAMIRELEALAAKNKELRETAHVLTLFQVLRAKREVDDARERVEESRAQMQLAQAQAEQAQAKLAQATKQLQVSQDKLAAAEKAAAEAKKTAPAKDAPHFTIYIRTQLAPEKAVRVSLTGSETVLTGVVYAAEEMAIKSDTLTSWVVRDKAILPVDLPAILKGDTKTNYQLKNGDQLFLQVKVGK